MWGKSYKAGRHMSRMSQDSSMRMTNRAEVGMGCAGLIGIAIVFLLVLAVFL